MRLIDADELYARLMNRYLMHNMKDDRRDMAARAAIGSCMEAVDRSKTITITPPPNAPLTLEELREMDGEPVWLVGADDAKIEQNGYAAVDFRYFGSENVPVIFWFGTATENEPDPGNYGKTWRAYRRRPEGTAHD